MIAFPDTSFLCAIAVSQANSPAAASHFAAMPEPLHVSSLLLFEFRQSVRFQIWLHDRNPAKGYPQPIASAALSKVDFNIQSSAINIVDVDWPDVFLKAEQLSQRHTVVGGHRGFDVLHVATALSLGASEFLTFDANQRRLAASEALTIRP